MVNTSVISKSTKTTRRGEQSAVRINTPLRKKDIKNLRIGDMVLISGRIVTGMDRIHKFLFKEKPSAEDIPFNLNGSVLYHCGPIINKAEEGHKFIAGGPSTSARFGMYAPWIINEYGIKAIIGKGGMDKKTHDALMNNGGIYLLAISAAVFIADRVKKVVDGWKVEEFGIPDAMWLLEIEDFPAIVTMDAHGNSLHEDIENISSENLRKLLHGANKTELMRS